MSKTAYEVVAQSIISQLEKDVAPWRKEWLSRGYKPTSMSSKKPCLLYTSPSPRDRQKSRMPSSA